MPRIEWAAYRDGQEVKVWARARDDKEEPSDWDELLDGGETMLASGSLNFDQKPDEMVVYDALIAVCNVSRGAGRPALNGILSELGQDIARKLLEKTKEA